MHTAAWYDIHVRKLTTILSCVSAHGCLQLVGQNMVYSIMWRSSLNGPFSGGGQK